VPTDSRLDIVRASAIPLLDGVAGDYDPILADTDGSRVVVLGIGCNGSHELFQARIELTKRLIADMGFSSVCLDEPSPVVHAIDAFLTGRTPANPVADPAMGFAAPNWSWRNAEMLAFLFWLRGNNDLFDDDRHKITLHSLDNELYERSVIWTDWHHLSSGADGVGRPARERMGRQAVLIGFTTWTGHILTDDAHTSPPHPIELTGSPDILETMLHRVDIPRFMLRLRDAPDRLAAAFRGTPAEQLDAIVHLDRSRALDALITQAVPESGAGVRDPAPDPVHN
jgi:erythromycin esterase-like protein